MIGVHQGPEAGSSKVTARFDQESPEEPDQNVGLAGASEGGLSVQQICVTQTQTRCSFILLLLRILRRHPNNMFLEGKIVHMHSR